jgi:hypothetical protein
METPQQFLESFLLEKTAAYAKANAYLLPVYAKYFGEPLSRHARDFMPRDKVQAVVEDVKQSADSATAITRQHLKKADIRTRYHLATIGDIWKIVRIDRECFLCRGTGQSGSFRCQTCGGEGWCDPRKDEA